MPVKIKKLGFEAGSMPGMVHVVLSDAETKEDAQIWISARFPLERRSDDKLAVIAQEALRELQNLIDEGIEAAKAPPR
jgi:hypothetical protein